MELRKYRILISPKFFNQFVIFYIMVPKQFAVPRLQLQCHDDSAIDLHNVPKWLWCTVDHDIDQNPS